MKLDYNQSIALITDIILNTEYNAIWDNSSEFWLNDRLLYFTFDRSGNTFQMVDRARLHNKISFYLTTKDFEDLLKLFTDRTKKYERVSYDVPEYMITDSIKRDIKISELL